MAKGGEWTPSDAQRKAYWAKMRKSGVKNRDVQKGRSKTFKQPPRDFMRGFSEVVDVSPLIHEGIIKALEATYKVVQVKKIY